MSVVRASESRGPMLAEMQIDAAAATDTGSHRKANADAFLVDLGAGLLAVSDGMGDTPRSGAIAKMALEAVRELFLSPWCQLPPAERWAGEAAERLILGVMQANGRLYAPGRTERPRLGTTFAGVVVCADRLCVAHAGDSRVYVLRASTGRLTKLTEDNTIINEALWGGMAWARAAELPNARALTRAIGLTPALVLRPVVQRWAPGDVVLACTDGITDWLDDTTITQTLVDCDVLETAAERLVRRALLAGGRDNATAVVARWVA